MHEPTVALFVLADILALVIRELGAGLFLVWLAVTAGCSAQPPPRSHPSPLLRAMIPSFQAQTANGGELDSNAFHGRPLVVSFFSSQCPRCASTLRATSDTYADLHDVTFVGVVDGDVHTALALSKEFGIRFPLVLDEGRQIARRFQVEDVPITFVADSRGWVSWVGGADLTEAALASALSAAR